MTTSPPTPVIYLMKLLVFNILGGDFFFPKSGHCHENQSQQDLVYKSGFVYVTYTLLVEMNTHNYQLVKHILL